MISGKDQEGRSVRDIRSSAFVLQNPNQRPGPPYAPLGQQDRRIAFIFDGRKLVLWAKLRPVFGEDFIPDCAMIFGLLLAYDVNDPDVRCLTC